MLQRGDVVVYKKCGLNGESSLNGAVAIVLGKRNLVYASKDEWDVAIVSLPAAEAANAVENCRYYEEPFFFEDNCEVIGHITLDTEPEL